MGGKILRSCCGTSWGGHEGDGDHYRRLRWCRRSGLLAFSIKSGWLGVVTAFAALQCFNGYKLAQALNRLEDTLCREGVARPLCGARPPLGGFSSCGICKSAFDTFASMPNVQSATPRFQKRLTNAVQSPFSNWLATAIADQTRKTPGLKANSPLVSPSNIPAIVGIFAGLGGLLLLLLAVLSFKLSSDDAARKLQYSPEIDNLWQSEGMPIPGQRY